jgi:YD repeat-containing protein
MNLDTEKTTLTCDGADNLTNILLRGGITTHFQPIISIRKMETVGYEGLSRGVAEGGDRLIGPDRLFTAAREQGRLPELDRLCREKTLETFAHEILARNPKHLAFVNFESSLLDQRPDNPGGLIELVGKLRLYPSNIVIEIVESKVKDLRALKNFVETHRYYGFLIALDDVGAGYSNFDRISLIKPDILKIDRVILKDIGYSYHKQEVFKSIINMAHNIGAVVIAEGVETEEEVLYCMTLGADLFQGFYFARPGPAASVGRDELLPARMAALAGQYKRDAIDKMRKSRQMQSLCSRIMKHVVNGLAYADIAYCEERLKELTRGNFLVEAVYVVDDRGVQVTDTIMNPGFNKKAHMLFQPAGRGDDHSMKEYIYPLLNTDLKRYTTDRYISLASGNICRTMSVIFRTSDRERYILCVDFRVDECV